MAPTSIVDAIDECTISFGWYIHPVDGKRPVERNWPTLSSNDPEYVRRWFLRNQAEGRATGIGISPGLSGLLIVDVDGPQGIKTLSAWDRSGRDLAVGSTRVEITPRGAHIFYSTPWPTRSGKEPGIDLLATGRQVVLAPSPHPSGGAYILANDAPVQPAPEFLLERLGPADPSLPRGAQELLDETRDGHRHQALWGVLGKLVHSGWADDKITDKVADSAMFQSKTQGRRDPDTWLQKQLAKWHDQHEDSRDYSGRDEVLARVEAARALTGTLNSSGRKVWEALARRGIELGSVLVTIGYEDLAVRSACSYSTVRRVLRVLTELRLIDRVATGHPSGDASEYHLLPIYSMRHELTTHEQQDQCASGWSEVAANSLDPGSDPSRYAVLGASWRYLQTLLVQGTAMTPMELSEVLGASPRTVRHHLHKLGERDLVVSHPGGGYLAHPAWRATLRRLTEEAGQVGRQALATRRLEANRRNRQESRINYLRQKTDEQIADLVEKGHGSFPDFLTDC